MSIHVTRAPTVPLTSYDTKRRSHFNCWHACIGSKEAYFEGDNKDLYYNT